MSTPVSDFVKIWVEDKQARRQAAINAGVYEEDAYYSEPEINEDYFDCVESTDAYGNDAWFKIGCSKMSIYKVDMIAYKTNACNGFYQADVSMAVTNGYEYISGLDMSAYQIDFENEDACKTCIDANEYDEYADAEEADEASVCELLWADSMFCDEMCEELGLTGSNNSWETMEIAILVLELVAFVAIMAGIGSKRSQMPAKDRLIEEATVASLGFKRSHIFGLALGTILITACLAAAKLVTPTMQFVAFIDFIALCYLLKLTLFSSKG